MQKNLKNRKITKKGEKTKIKQTKKLFSAIVYLPVVKIGKHLI